MRLTMDAGACVEALALSSVNGLSKKLEQLPGITTAEAEGLLEMVSKSVLPEDSKRTAAQVISKHIVAKGDSACDAPGNKMQRHDYFENYLREEDWAVLASPTTCDAEKLNVLAQRAVLIGLHHPVEVTSRKVCAIKFAGDKAVFDARNALREVREWKKLVRSQSFGFAWGPAMYPSDPRLLKESHPQLWELSYTEAAGPVPSKISKLELARMEHRTPCRSTKTGCGDLPPMRAKPSLCDNSGPMQHALLDALVTRCLDVQSAHDRKLQLAIMDKEPVVSSSCSSAPGAVPSSFPTSSGVAHVTSSVPSVSCVAPVPGVVTSPFPSFPGVPPVPASWLTPTADATAKPEHAHNEMQIDTSKSMDIPGAKTKNKSPSLEFLIQEMQSATSKKCKPDANGTDTDKTSRPNANDTDVIFRPGENDTDNKSKSEATDTVHEKKSKVLKRPACKIPVVKQDFVGDVPNTWTTIKRRRLSGPHAGQEYREYKTPEGKVLRSLKAVREYMSS